MHISCLKYRVFLQKKLNCLTEKDEIFLTCRWCPSLKKSRKRFFSQWSYSLWKRYLKYPNICFQSSWAQISAWEVLEDLFNSSPKLWRSEFPILKMENIPLKLVLFLVPEVNVQHWCLLSLLQYQYCNYPCQNRI